MANAFRIWVEKHSDRAQEKWSASERLPSSKEKEFHTSTVGCGGWGGVGAIVSVLAR